jgi:hypothetical protein
MSRGAQGTWWRALTSEAPGRNGTGGSGAVQSGHREPTGLVLVWLESAGEKEEPGQCIRV